ncbi:LVIVD repeat-containing protein [Nocardioides sp. GXQ0305]|uniref:LVIVD repeat-containing protein n=1 Tax=Nocardioides sp. GXQ0305 TaxID=3423912 RepID=UPI003D7DD0E6
MSRQSRIIGVIAASCLALTGLSAMSPSQAHEGHGSPRPVSEKRDPTCGPEERELARAGDRFAQGCLTERQEERLQAAEPEPELEAGEMASEDMGLIANIPKNGAFADVNSFSSDLAFQGKYAYGGNYNGFTVYDISKPSQPKQVAQVLCPGSQNDVSVYRDLLVLSTDSSRSDDSCASTSQSATMEDSWEGIKVFDISDPTSPEYVAAVETKCGSHTHTLAPDQRGRNLYVYVSSYSPNTAYPDCQPPHDIISVVRVPVANPAASSLADEAVVFPEGGNPGGNGSSTTSGCHDITAYPKKDIAAGACMGDGVLMDISDRTQPEVIESVRDTENFAFWHSATFNNKGTKVVFTDELGGGGAPTCNEEVGDTRGANGIYDVTKRDRLKFASYYKIDRVQSNNENCVAHNGSLIPVKGKDIMVQAWYQGGISVFDFTNSSKPRELAWFDRGELSSDELILGGSWSAYYYNGHVYSNDIQKGLDVLRITDKAVTKAERYRYRDAFNPQSQPSFNG